MLSLGAAVVARRELPMRVLALEIVNQRGEPAGRLRLLWRRLLIWAPLGALALTPVALMAGSPRIIAVGVVSRFAVAASLVTAWRAPGRGLTERLSGTMIIPE